MARLKVFTSPQGFYETVVAASSQKAALDAWGTHQNLFADGMAALASDPQAIDAALASPGQVLQRPAGSDGPFGPAGQGPLPSAPKLERPRAARTNVQPSALKPAPDRSALSAAEKALAAAVERHAVEQADIDRERAELDAREFNLRQAARDEHKSLQADLDRARRAYEKAGGSP